ncbi:hypothetical protein LguiA_026159 [Lonicera macranthoides]
MICAYESFEWPALEKLKICGCCSLRKLPFNKDNAKNLSSLKAEEKWWEAMLWQDCAVKMHPPTMQMAALNAVIEEKYKSVDPYGGSFNGSLARVCCCDSTEWQMNIFFFSLLLKYGTEWNQFGYFDLAGMSGGLV